MSPFLRQRNCQFYSLKDYLIRNWRIKSITHSEAIKKSELMFTFPISLSRNDFNSIRESLVETIKQISEKVKASPAEDIACFNLDLFWVGK